MNSVVTVSPRPGESACVYAEPGTTIRVDRGDPQPREYPQKQVAGIEWPVIAIIWPPEFGGAAITCYGGLAGVRNGHHNRDRPVWSLAAKEVRRRTVVYVQHELRDWYGRLVWQATGVRYPEAAAHLPEDARSEGETQ